MAVIHKEEIVKGFSGQEEVVKGIVDKPKSIKKMFRFNGLSFTTDYDYDDKNHE